MDGKGKNSYKKDIRLLSDKVTKKKILVVCQYYYPENFQITPICEQLVEDGYDVTVLTGLPNYPTGFVPNEYKAGHRDEVVNGVHVIRCNEIGRGRGIIKLALNYGSFTLASLLKVDKLSKDFNLVLVYQLSPVLMGLPGIKYARKHKVPLLIYCCDLWPESLKMYITNEKNIIFKIVNLLSKKIYSAADIVIGQSKSFLPYLKRTHGLKDDKLIYVPGFADEKYLNQDFTSENENVNFVFLGNLGIAQNLTAVLTAVNKIKDIPGFKVHFVGDGTCINEMKEYVKNHHLKHIVVFHGRRPVEEMPKYYKLADACLVSLRADNATGLTLPSKVQGYMAAGKPIIGMIDGSAKEVIEESGCGICVNADDINGLAEVMKAFIKETERYKDCGKKGREYFKSNFRKSIVIGKLETIMDGLISTRR